MHLRADQYQQIVKQLRSETVSGRSSERRGSPRVGLRAQVRIIPCRTGIEPTAITAWVRDVSVEGVGFIFPMALEAGTYLVMSLPIADGEDPTLDLLFVVVRCNPLSNGHFSIGASFQRVITAEDVK
jgi:hypothetical protein